VPHALSRPSSHETGAELGTSTDVISRTRKRAQEIGSSDYLAVIRTDNSAHARRVFRAAQETALVIPAWETSAEHLSFRPSIRRVTCTLASRRKTYLASLLVVGTTCLDDVADLLERYPCPLRAKPVRSDPEAHRCTELM